MELLKLMLVAFAIASAAAQQCIPNAYPDANGKCQCNAGRSGHPDLCCYPSNYKACWVAGDPVLTSYTGHKVGLDFPCGTLISSTKVKLAGPQVNVYASSKEMSTGSIFTSKVVIEIVENGKRIVLTFNFEEDPVRIDEKWRNFPLMSVYINEGMTKLVDNTGFNAAMSIHRSEGMELYTVKIGKVVITVRPPRGDDTNLSYSAGLCVAEPKTSTLIVPPLYACHVTRDISKLPLTQYLDVAILPMIYYMRFSPILTESTSSDYAPACAKFRTSAQRCPNAHRKNALKKCAFILFHSVARRCFYAAGNGPRPVMTAFQHCVDAYCQGSRRLCEAMKKNKGFRSCGSSLMNCDKWPMYLDVNSRG